ncbi:neurexin-4-like [Paramacrobiotus metropolitanus]|uniref:neurexin-4-like n=1 Tax=Paramacrobiotus metropolitanus TaxID=2943436 RepID=UPI002445CBBF|nr:neurexin-4-like [Paramacrobiotus metropolitanus]
MFVPWPFPEDRLLFYFWMFALVLKNVSASCNGLSYSAENAQDSAEYTFRQKRQSDEKRVVLPMRGQNFSCDLPLLRYAKLTASSSSGPAFRSADSARFTEGGAQNAWSPTVSDFNQYLLIDLLDIKRIWAVATMGRAKTQEYVVNYTLDYGQTADNLVPFTDQFNAPKVFHGNKDSVTVQRNDLEYPLVARFIRINPRQWSHSISIRMELYGCDHDSDMAHFDGSGYIRIDLAFNPIAAVEDSLHFRFKTVQPDGLLVFSEGSQGDILLLQLVRSRLYLTMGLGGGYRDTLPGGSALDDGLWHTVRVIRDEKHLKFIVDNILQTQILSGGYYKLNLENQIFIGGMDNLRKYGVQARTNFYGCMENLRFNNTNIFWQLQHIRPPGFERVRGIGFFCPEIVSMPMTFTSSQSYLIVAAQTSSSINISFQFRTFDNNGLFLFREFENGFIKLFLDRHRLKLRIKTPEIPLDTIEAFAGVTVNDGMWHSYSVSARLNQIIQTLDQMVATTKRLLSFTAKPEYVFGYRRAEDELGIRGCLRKLVVDGMNLDITAMASRISASYVSQVLFNECPMRDRCIPNPCHHKGICRQSWEEFTCDCSRTGYGGAVCRSSSHPMTCEEYKLYNPQSREAQIQLDLDGSGYLEPFPVLCKFFVDERTETHVNHDSMAETAVDGYQSPASYVQHIRYNASWSQLTALVNYSASCRQYIKYTCLNAKLLSSPVGPPFGYWVSRTNQKMINWGGASPGTPMCACGLTDSCFQRTRGCNCDTDENPLRNTWLTDEGWLAHKDHLPVRQLLFGDTGIADDRKESRYQLGPLICEGNSIIDNAVTFWRQDATLVFPYFEWTEGDIYFHFRTTVESGVFIHAQGLSDEIKVILIGPTEIQFEYTAGNGPRSVSLHVTRPLNDNQWHSVLVERNRKEARIRVDGALSADLAVTEAEYREMQLGYDLMIGAATDLSGGFVGCLRSLFVNGLQYNLRLIAELGAYGLLPGCVGKCDKSPCMNNGVCQERYDSYKCDCRFTAFRGPLCSDEIGAHFRTEDQVEYHFTNNSISTVEEHIHVGFVTTEPRGLLMQIVGAHNEYISVEISNAGTIRVAFDLGFQRQELYEESHYYPNGQFHDIHVWRSNEGRTINIQADGYYIVSRTYRIGKKQDAQLNDVRTIYLGRNSEETSFSVLLQRKSRAIAFD